MSKLMKLCKLKIDHIKIEYTKAFGVKTDKVGYRKNINRTFIL